ncbi:hypothetical protein ACIA8E_06290 [Streptomyces sp. NPDC051664]|uniref:hypothetical protein n=1 Tax=Streptomyces sp. NPDC051664 TaxID=3365668 RepID=UPI00378E3590
MLSAPAADPALRTPVPTGPKAPMTTVMRIGRLGGPPAAEPVVPHAVPYRDAA